MEAHVLSVGFFATSNLCLQKFQEDFVAQENLEHFHLIFGIIKCMR